MSRGGTDGPASQSSPRPVFAVNWQSLQKGEVNRAGGKGKQTALGLALPHECRKSWYWQLTGHKELEHRKFGTRLSSLFKEDGRVRD